MLLQRTVLSLFDGIFSPRVCYYSTRFGQPVASTHPHLVKEGELVPGISATEFELRRSSLFRQLPDKSLGLVAAYPLKYMSHDIPYSFRQESNFYYLSGFLEPDGVLAFIKRSEHEKKLLMFVPPRVPEREIWDGPSTGVDRAKEVFGLDEVFSIKQMEEVLQPEFFKTNVLMLDPTVNGSVTEVVGWEDKPQTFSIRELVERIRMSKSNSEVELMRKSCQLAGTALKRTMELTKPGDSEHIIHSRFEYLCKEAGAERLSYPPVVAAGANACTLHYINNDDVSRDGDLLLMDAGCEFHMYSSDITRTYPVNGKFTAPQREVYELVLDVQKKCIEKCVPGTAMATIHFESVEMLRKGLEKLGVRGSVTKYYPHSIGHQLGIDVHDCHTISSFHLQPGVVVTIEPGLYLPVDPDVPEKYRGIGVRIEDDILITEGGPEVLSYTAPKEVDEIERIVGTKVDLLNN